MPTQKQIAKALGDAGSAHHDYESNYLDGQRDEQWPGWYAAFIIGRLGDFATPTTLARLLSEASGSGDWAQVAATHVVSNVDAA